ncbi:MAG: NAD-dependent epimerase/dehydratase family protein, partial [Actinomycetota bacterium]
GVGRIVYVSTINYFGNTLGRVLDETDERPVLVFVSCYDETKYRAHEAAKQRIEKGAPAIIVQPGSVYGRGDHSIVGQMISDAATGRLRMKMFPETGFNLVYVDDVVDGILLAHDKGVVGECYVLGGEISTMGDLVDKAAGLSGRKAPRLTLPPVLARVSAPFGPLIGRAMGLPPNMRELIAASDGVTYWAKDDKARRELGYRPRSLDEGLRELLSPSAS